MKKVIMSLLLVASISSADQAGNEQVCNVFKSEFPNIAKVGLDALSILKQKDRECSNFTAEDWKSVGSEPVFGALFGLYIQLDSGPAIERTCTISMYEKIVKEAKAEKVSTVRDIQILVERVAPVPTPECLALQDAQN